MVALLHIGRRARAGRLREAVTTFLGLCGVVLATLGVTLAAASYMGMHSRGEARAPVYSHDDLGADSSDILAYYSISDFYLEDSARFVTVVAVIPASDSVPPPPGLPRWPEKGEVWVSEQLERIDPDGRVASIYGQIAGTIGDEGLVSPTEILMYTNPDSPRLNLDAFYQVTGYLGSHQEASSGGTGSSGSLSFGDDLELPPFSQYLAGYVIAVGLSVIGLCTVSLGAGLSRRRNESRILAILGFTGFQQLSWHAGSLLIPVVLASGITGLVIAVCSTMNLPVPLTGYVLSSSDIRAGIWLILGSAVAAMVVYCAIWLMLSVARGSKQPVRREEPRALTYRRSRLALFALTVPVLVVSLQVDPQVYPFFAFGAFAICLLLVAVCLGDLIRFILAALVRSMRSSAARRGDPELLVASANLEAHGRNLVSMAALLASAVIGFSLINSMLTAWAAPDPQSVALVDRYEGKVNLIAVGESWSRENTLITDRAIATMPSVGIVGLMTARDDTFSLDSEVTLTWSNNPSSAGGQYENPVAELAAYIEPLTIPGAHISYVEHSPFEQLRADGEAGFPGNLPADESGTRTLVLIASPGRNLDQFEAYRAFVTQTFPTPNMVVPSSDYVYGRQADIDRSSWIRFFSALGIAALLTGVGVALSDEKYEATGHLGRLSALAGRRLRLWKMTAVRVAVPLACGTGLGLAIGVPLNLMLDHAYEVLPGPHLLYAALTGAVTVILGLAITTVLTSMSQQRMSLWRSHLS